MAAGIARLRWPSHSPHPVAASDPPVSLVVHGRSRVLEVGFADGASYRIPFELMRVLSPSAEVQGHGPGQDVLQDLDPGELVRTVRQQPALARSRRHRRHSPTEHGPVVARGLREPGRPGGADEQGLCRCSKRRLLLHSCADRPSGVLKTHRAATAFVHRPRPRDGQDNLTSISRTRTMDEDDGRPRKCGSRLSLLQSCG